MLSYEEESDAEAFMLMALALKDKLGLLPTAPAASPPLKPHRDGAVTLPVMRRKNILGAHG